MHEYVQYPEGQIKGTFCQTQEAAMFLPISCRRILSILCLLLVITTLSPLSLQATGEPAQGADIVFLIDQSGSMRISDPLGLRFDGLQYATEWLGRTILEYDPEHQYSFRVAVIDFGTYARQVLDPIEIAPTSEETWQDVSVFLQKRLAAENRRELGTTELVPAFGKAAEVFAAWGDATPDRQRIMILLTDGLPYPDPESAMQRLQAYYTTNFPYPDYQLYVIGLSSAESPWPLFADDWSNLSNNQAQAVENRRLLGAHFQRVLGQVGESLGIQGEQVTECGMVAVAPYLDLVRFTIHNPDPAAPVKIYDTSNQLINVSDSGDIIQIGNQMVEVRGHDTPIEAITIYNPSPGYWRVECPASVEGRPAIFVRQVSAHSQIEMPGQRLALGVPYAITFRLFDHSGKPLAQDNDPRYALDVRLSAVAPEQTDTRPDDVILRYDSTTLTYQGTMTPMASGEWTYRLGARSAAPDGSDRIVADFISPSTLVSRPQASISLGPGRVWQLMPVSLTLTLADAEGRPFVKTTEILNALMAEATVLDGSQTITVPLQSTDSGLYVGAFVPYASGDHTAQGRLYMLDPSRTQPVLIAEGPSSTQFNVEPVALKPGLEPALLTQLVPATVRLDLPAEQADALNILKEPASWVVHMDGLGPLDPEITRSAATESGVSLEFTPKSVGEFRPELTLTVHRAGQPEPASAIRPDLGSVRISPPQVITSTVDAETEEATCVLSAKLLDAAGQLFARTMDQNYNLVVTARDASKPDTPEIALELDDDGFHRSITPPTSGRPYLLKVEAQKDDERIQIVDDIALAVPACSLFAPGGVNRAWIVVIAVISVLLLTLIVLGILLLLKRRSQPDPDKEKNSETSGHIVLQRPKGTDMAYYDLAKSDLVRQVWDPVEVMINGQKVTCPVGCIKISQNIMESRGETTARKIGANVTVFYEGGFNVFNGPRWIDDTVHLELKDQWWITFRLPLRKTPIRPAPEAEGPRQPPGDSIPGGVVSDSPSKPRPISDSVLPKHRTEPDAPTSPAAGATTPRRQGTSSLPRPDSEDLIARKGE